MDNLSIAKLLRKVSAAYLLKDENRFKIIAYDRAADTIEHATSEAKDLWEQGKLTHLPGVGSAIAGHLDELFRTGKVKHFDEVLKGLPPGIFPLLEISGFGPKKAYKLITSLHLEHEKDPINKLLESARENKIAKIEGFGSKSQEDIITRLTEFKNRKNKTVRMVLPYAYELANRILTHLRKSPAVIYAEPLGSLRRMVATIGDIDIAVAARSPKEVLEWFTRYPGVERVLERGPQTSSILVSGGRQVDLMVQPPGAFGALLQHFTGSKNHNIRLREYALKKGISLSEHGMKQNGKLAKFAKEDQFYKALGLPWIPPEIREDQGEIEAAVHNRLPQLVELKDIKGDLHIHTSYDLEPSHDLGKSSLKEILLEATRMGYEYIGISDHNPSSSRHSKDEIKSIMRRRKEYYEHISSSLKSVRTKIVIMLEIDILSNGTLALPEEAFEYIDAAIASVHSSFDQPKGAMTKRVLKALAHPKVKILGHPTGRLLEKREGYEMNWEEVFGFCKDHQKALEINSYPDRLDLPDSLVHDAVKSGVKFTIDTDSHDVRHLELMRYGVAVARRGWATRQDILNALPYNEFKKWLVRT